MKQRAWKIQREIVPQTDGQRRWDLAYQCLLKWEKERKQSPNYQEVSHENSDLCTGIDPTPSADPDHRTTD